MAMSFFPLFDGLDQSFGNAAEGDGVDRGLGGVVFISLFSVAEASP